MRYKGIWIAVACILVIGTGATYSTKTYVENLEKTEQMGREEDQPRTFVFSGSSTFEAVPEAGSAMKNKADLDAKSVKERLPAKKGERVFETEIEIAEALPAGAPKARPPELERDSEEVLPEPQAVEGQAGAEGRSLGLEEAGVALAAALPETAAAFSDQNPSPGESSEPSSFSAARGDTGESGPISPLEGVKNSKARPEVNYRKKLEELDNQISKMREGETDSNVYSVKTSAETELKMWEGEMGAVYNALLELSSEEEAKRLASEQQEWLKNRDAQAAKVSGKTGSSVESASYSAALASLTRDRAYELTGLYEEASGVKEESTAG